MNTNYVNFSNDENEPVVEEFTTAEFLDCVDTSSVEGFENAKDETKMGKVICRKLYLRSKPSTESKEVTILNKDEELMVVSEKEEWYEVYTAAGQEGFCKKEFIKVG